MTGILLGSSSRAVTIRSATHAGRHAWVVSPQLVFRDMSMALATGHSSMAALHTYLHVRLRLGIWVVLRPLGQLFGDHILVQGHGIAQHLRGSKLDWVEQPGRPRKACNTYRSRRMCGRKVSVPAAPGLIQP